MSEKKGFLAMAKLGVVLALYATAACVGLAFVYSGTSGIISTRQQAELEEALRDLFPDADSFEPITDIRSLDPAVTIEGDKNNPGNTGAFAVKNNNGAYLGVALRTSRGGYGGPVKLLVGVGTDGRIRGIKILEHSETPGLGANMTRPSFVNQFTNKPVSDAFAVKQDVDAITASTITSVTVSASVKAAGEAALAWLNDRGAR